MCNDEIFEKIQNDLEKREVTIANNIVYLNSQGYSVNRVKQDKLSITIALLIAFKNIDIFSKEEQDKIEHFYYNFITL